jgi:hypothetical protein
MLQRVKTGEALAHDKQRARAVINPLIGKYFVGQNITRIDKDARATRERDIIRVAMQNVSIDDEQFNLKMRAAKAVAEAIFDDEDAPVREAYKEAKKISEDLDARATEKFGEKFLSRLDYWREKARRVKQEGRSEFHGFVPLWCDHATALVIDLLAGDPEFTSTLDVVKQGSPQVDGHWYVLANREGDIQYGRALTENEFVIDLWGALRLNLSSAVLDAGTAVDTPGQSGVLNLFPTDRLESVMTVPEKQRSDADLIADALLDLERIEPEPRAGAGDEDLNELLAQLRGEQQTQTKSADELYEAAFSGGEGVTDLDELLATLDKEKETKRAAPASVPRGDGDS